MDNVIAVAGMDGVVAAAGSDVVVAAADRDVVVAITGGNVDVAVPRDGQVEIIIRAAEIDVDRTGRRGEHEGVAGVCGGGSCVAGGSEATIANQQIRPPACCTISMFESVSVPAPMTPLSTTQWPDSLWGCARVPA